MVGILISMLFILLQLGSPDIHVSIKEVGLCLKIRVAHFFCVPVCYLYI